MRRPSPLLLVLAAACAVCPLASCGTASAPSGGRPTYAVGPTDDLQALLDTVRGPARITLAAGDYHLRAVAFTDATCGNCQDPTEEVPATRGILVQGDSIDLVGVGAADVVLHTSAGYGVLFDGCSGCSLSGVTVTDGVRDPDGRATDAGVVVRGGRVTLTSCVIRDNLGDSATVNAVVVGVMGVAVREDGTAIVRDCRIERNSWDGIGAYRDARVVAIGNVVDGVDKAHGAQTGGGRGVGIGLTWNARGIVRGNLVTRYWKGIGVFVDAQASITDNVVEDVLTWGLAYWGPDGGRPVAWIAQNAVFETGACGVIVDREAPYGPEATAHGRGDGMDTLADDGPGELVDNAFVRTGRNEAYDSGEPYCPQRPIARVHVPGGFAVARNLVWDVRQPGAAPAPLPDTLDAGAFAAAVAPLARRLRGWPNLEGSRFVGAFGTGG